MAILDAITVTVIVDGKTLPEYDDPEAEPGDNNAKTMIEYVEATTGAKFGLRINFKPSFDLCDAESIRVSLFVDGQGAGSRNLAKHQFTTFSSMTTVLDQAVHFNKETCKKTIGHLAFGSLDIVEGATAESNKLDTSQVKDLGTISAIITRTNITKLRRPKPYGSSGHSTVSEVSEKALKGRAISNTVILVDTKERDGVLQTHRYPPIKGRNGEPYKFKFYYRSKDALRILGCIPRSPTPAIAQSIGSTRSVTEVAGVDGQVGDRETEIRNLRARLEELEKETKPIKKENIKAEDTAGRASGHLNSGSRVKREMDDGEVTILSSRKRNKAIETVDLTED